jgi:N-terminal domain of reverse transcriptase
MSEPKGTLDTSVNGPEDPPGVFDADAWQQVDWRMHEQRVRRLRRRIFKAVREGDLATARNLQKLMLRSWSNTLVSVRQVTQRNAGRATAGIDGRVALTAQARAEVAMQVHATRSSWRPVAVKRVYIPKAHDKTSKRPLGIPVIMDRCHQARVRQALEPEWEARFEARSYGFRRAHDRDPVGGEHGVERGSELAVPVPDQVSDLRSPIAEVHQQVPGALGDPRPIRGGGDPEQPDPPGGELDDEEDV